MKKLFDYYIDKFNSDDNEYYKSDIDNSKAKVWLYNQIPKIEIPDKTLEEIYYFRWWVFRKHIKCTEDGYVITEFLPSVPWGGKYNTIIAAAGHHISEGKWLKDGKKICNDYIKFWLEEKSKTYLYSSWIIYSLYELCEHNNDFSFGIENIALIKKYFDTVYEEHDAGCGLLWSLDNNDAMEFSISGGCLPEDSQKGVRPTLNSYMAANAWAISEIAKKANLLEDALIYAQIFKSLKEKISEILWDGEFYKAIHTKDLSKARMSDVLPEFNAKELIGYIPWCFNLAPEGYESAFKYLKDKECFLSEFGVTTAQRSHPRYLYEKKHECLWNGYIWPFATSQVLYAVNNLLENYHQNIMTKQDFYDILLTYAENHYLIDENEKKICWIDEVIHPETGEWSSREKLKNWGWKETLGGFERGKDYNHSAFCDIVLSGLLGIKVQNGQISVNPKVPDDWENFTVSNLWVDGNRYKIIYDRDNGVSVLKDEEC